MKIVRKILIGLVALVVLVVGGAWTWATAKWPPKFPDVPTPQITASNDPEVIAAGEYLFHTVAHCTICHAPMEDMLALKPGERAVPKGGHEWHMGPLGTIRAVNITQDPKTGIGNLTDGQIARVLKHGVRHDDLPALFMFAVGPMTDEDLTALVSYVRTIPPVENQIAPHDIGFLGKLMLMGPMSFYASPKPDMPAPPFAPPGETSVARGRYIAEGPGSCFGCHSQWDFDTMTVKSLFSGGQEGMPDEANPEMEYFPPNLTPDPETGIIAGWTEEQWMTRLGAGRLLRTSPMQWENVREMTDSDKRSIWLYLRELAPVENDTGPPYRKAGWEPG